MRLLGVLIALALSMALLTGAGDGTYRGGSYDVAGGSYVASGSARIDTVTMVFVAKAGCDYQSDSLDSMVAVADTVLVLGTDVPEFRFANIAYDNQDAFDGSQYSVYQNAGEDSWLCDDAERSTPLMYLDWAEYIPANATILHAEFRAQSSGTWYVSAADSVCTTLMTNAEDSAWWDQETATYSFLAPATWNNAASGAPWSLDDRLTNDQWGDVTEWGGNNTGANWTGDEGMVWPLTKVVQGAVNGLVNNGIRLWRTDSDGSAEYNFAHWGIIDVGGFDDRPPVISVTYTTEKHSSPFPGGADWAFVFSTDDGVQDFNTAMVTVFNNFDAHFSICVIGGATGAEGYATYENLKDWHADGHDIGYHSYLHDDWEADDGQRGLAGYDLKALTTDEFESHMAPSDLSVSATAYDSLQADINPNVMTAGMLADQGVDLSASDHWMKTFALPFHNWSGLVPRALAAAGYTSMRCGQMNHRTEAYGDHQWYTKGTIRSWADSGAVADTMRVGFIPHDRTRPRNMLGVPMTIGINDIVGDDGDNTVSEATVLGNFARIVEKIRAQGYGVISTFSHELKISPGGGTYPDGVDPDEMTWILQYVTDNNGAIMSVQEYNAWMKRRWTPTDTPAAFGQAAPINCTAAERIWYKP